MAAMAVALATIELAQDRIDRIAVVVRDVGHQRPVDGATHRSPDGEGLQL